MTELNLVVAHSLDDAYEAGNGTFSNTITLGYMRANTDDTSSLYRCTGHRYTGISGIKGGTILEAYEEIFEEGGDDPHGDIYCNDVDDPNNFDDEQDVIGRARTTASAPWSTLNIANDQYVQGPSLVDPIQEIADRPGLADALVTLWIARTDDAKSLVWHSKDNPSGNIPKLYIRYTPAVTFVPKVIMF